METGNRLHVNLTIALCMVSAIVGWAASESRISSLKKEVQIRMVQEMSTAYAIGCMESFGATTHSNPDSLSDMYLDWCTKNSLAYPLRSDK
jgi:hypothetical protein